MAADTEKRLRETQAKLRNQRAYIAHLRHTLANAEDELALLKLRVQRLRATLSLGDPKAC